MAVRSSFCALPIKLILSSHAAKPRFSPPASMDAIVAGAEEDVTILCGPVDSQTPVNFTWQLNDGPLELDESLTLRLDAAQKMATLSLADISYADAGRYRCTVSNAAGSIERVTTLEVRGMPS